MNGSLKIPRFAAPDVAPDAGITQSCAMKVWLEMRGNPRMAQFWAGFDHNPSREERLFRSKPCDVFEQIGLHWRRI